MGKEPKFLNIVTREREREEGKIKVCHYWEALVAGDKRRWSISEKLEGLILEEDYCYFQE